MAYQLIVSATKTAIPVGAAPPVYNAQAGAWITDAGVFSGPLGAYTPQEIPAAQAFSTKVTRPQLKLLFGAAAYAAAVASADPQVQFFLGIVDDAATTEIDLANPEVSGSLAYLASINLLTAAQLATIEQGWPL